ncbi:MAG: XisI protein [Caldilineaceae bacterium]
MARYRALIKDFFIRYAELLSAPPSSPLEINLALDDERQQYFLVQSGWEGKRYVRHTLLHLFLRNNKIWIEEDLTEEGIAAWLLAQGVPTQDIVLAFQPPQMRPHSLYAVA